MHIENTSPIPQPAFAEIGDVFRMYVRLEDEDGPSFINKNFMSSRVIPEDIRGIAVHQVHSRFRRLGKDYGDLLKPLHGSQISEQDIQKKFEEYSEANTDTITLYFARDTDHPQSITIPNRKVGGPLDIAEGTIAQTLFLLGLAAKEIESRSRDDSQFIVTHLGQADNIIHRMCFAHKYIYKALRDQGYAEEAIGEIIRDSNLDIDRSMIPIMLGKMGTPIYRESMLVNH